MKRLIGSWLDAFGYLLDDELISFYTFFTVVFAECAALWAFCSASIAIPFTVILIAYILNILILSDLKGKYEGCKKEVTISIFYVIITLALFITGFFFDWRINLICTAILFGVTALWIGIRLHQCTLYVNSRNVLVMLINSLFQNEIFWVFSQIIVIGAPFAAFVTFFAMIPAIPLALKIIVPIAYFILIPFIAVLEDETAACNVFEIAYDIMWSKELEESYNRIVNAENKEEKSDD